MYELLEDGKDTAASAMAGRIDALGWGIFLIWAGAALLLNVGWGAGILGVGLIALAVQATRRYYALPIEYFGMVFGTALVAWGVWELLGVRFPTRHIPGGFVPILLIVAGLALLLKAFFRRPAH